MVGAIDEPALILYELAPIVKILFVYEEGTFPANNENGTLTKGWLPTSVKELPVLIETSNVNGPLSQAETVKVFGAFPIMVLNSPKAFG